MNTYNYVPLVCHRSGEASVQIVLLNQTDSQLVFLLRFMCMSEENLAYFVSGLKNILRWISLLWSSVSSDGFTIRSMLQDQCTLDLKQRCPSEPGTGLSIFNSGLLKKPRIIGPYPLLGLYFLCDYCTVGFSNKDDCRIKHSESYSVKKVSGNT